MSLRNRARRRSTFSTHFVREMGMSRIVRTTAVALAAVSALTLSACGDDASTGSSTGSAGASSSASSASENSHTAADVNAELISNTKADTQQLLEATDAFLQKESVSETSKGIARETKQILDKQLASLSEVSGGVALVAQDEVTRVKESNGASADIAYLTLLENNLGRLADAWQGLKSANEQRIAAIAEDTADQMAAMKVRVDKRLQF